MQETVQFWNLREHNAMKAHVSYAIGLILTTREPMAKSPLNAREQISFCNFFYVRASVQLLMFQILNSEVKS